MAGLRVFPNTSKRFEVWVFCIAYDSLVVGLIGSCLLIFPVKIHVKGNQVKHLKNL